jgi:hypothetical protein
MTLYKLTALYKLPAGNMRAACGQLVGKFWAACGQHGGQYAGNMAGNIAGSLHRSLS